MLSEDQSVATVPPPPVQPSPEIPAHGRRSRLAFWIAGAAALGLAALVVARRPRTSASSAATVAPETATVKQGGFVRTLRLSGSTQAVESYPIVAPRLAGEPASSLTIVRLQPNGAHVKRGDLLVEFDRQNEIKSYLTNRATYLDLLHQIAEQKASAAAAKAQDETNIQTAMDQLSTAQLEMQRLEILPRIQQQITREQLTEAQATLKELQQTYNLRRQAAAAGLRDLEIQAAQARANMLHSQHNEERMAITAPIAGVVVLQSIWKQGRFGQVEEGDQVYPGTGFMQVVNPSAMQVTAMVNQIDVLSLHAGQRGRVRLDAYPSLAFPATLAQLSPIGSPGQFSGTVRTFRAIFSIQGHNPKLMPDLSAAVDVQLEHRRGVLLLPRGCVFYEGGRSYVRIKKGVGFEKRPVTLGPENNLVEVVESGLRAGDVVACGG
jgi:HlyD family secretion protein